MRTINRHATDDLLNIWQSLPKYDAATDRFLAFVNVADAGFSTLHIVGLTQADVETVQDKLLLIWTYDDDPYWREFSSNYPGFSAMELRTPDCAIVLEKIREAKAQDTTEELLHKMAWLVIEAKHYGGDHAEWRRDAENYIEKYEEWKGQNK